MLLLVFDAAVGVFLVAAIAIAAQRPRRCAPSNGVQACGWTLVAVPLPLAVVLHVTLSPPTGIDQAAFLTGIAAFALGALLLLGRDEEYWREEPDGDATPWWPAFERDLHEYELKRTIRR
jgi:hypothetical protein